MYKSKTLYWLQLFFASASLATACFLQGHYDLNPCPLCLLQRAALLGIMLGTGAALVRWKTAGVLTAGASALLGLGTALWHTYLQSHPQAFASCAPETGYIFGHFSLLKAIPLLFHGTGDCMQVDWTFGGITLPQLSALVFGGFLVLVGKTAFATKKHA